VIWVALTISVIASATALAALRQARAARAVAGESRRRASAAEEWAAVLDKRIARHLDEGMAGEPTPRQLIAAALDDGERVSGACHAVTRALDDGREPPTSSDYARVQRCSEEFTASIGRMRAEHGDAVRELTDELVTVHHSVLAEVRQHQEARFPFVGAKDTTLASLVLSRFDAELARLRQYQQTGQVPVPQQVPVDFDTVRFVPRQSPTPGPQQAPDSH
jgi:hypothetical protein